MRQCKHCRRKLTTPLDEYGDSKHPMCWRCWFKSLGYTDDAKDMPDQRVEAMRENIAETKKKIEDYIASIQQLRMGRDRQMALLKSQETHLAFLMSDTMKKLSRWNKMITGSDEVREYQGGNKPGPTAKLLDTKWRRPLRSTHRMVKPRHVHR